MSEQQGSPVVRTSQTWMAPKSALAKRGSGCSHAARIGSDFSLTPPTHSRQTPSLLARFPLAARRSPHPAAKPLRPRGFSHRLAMRKALSLFAFWGTISPHYAKSALTAVGGPPASLNDPTNRQLLHHPHTDRPVLLRSMSLHPRTAVGPGRYASLFLTPKAKRLGSVPTYVVYDTVAQSFGHEA